MHLLYLVRRYLFLKVKKKNKASENKMLTDIRLMLKAQQDAFRLF